jgi:TRAP-type mannitol/chloroaromatic compound transport system substrate-binding protein
MGNTRSVKMAMILMVLVLTLGIILAACGGTTGSSDVYRINLQSLAPPGSFMEENFNEEWVFKMEAAAEGKLEITHTGSNSIVPDLELLKAVEEGVVDMGYTVSLYWAKTMPMAAIQYGFPQQNRGPQDLVDALEAGILDIYRDAYAERNVHYIASGIESTLDLCTTVPINSLDDVNGLKIRAGGAYGDMLADFGASVVMMPGSDIYTSVTTGVIEGFVFGNIYSADLFGFLETTNYVIDPPLVGVNGGGTYMMNLDKWNTLPRKIQKVIEDVTYQFTKEFLSHYPSRDEDKALAESYGIQFTSLPQSDLDKIAAWTIDALAELGNANPGPTKEAADLYIKLINER